MAAVNCGVTDCESNDGVGTCDALEIDIDDQGECGKV